MTAAARNFMKIIVGSAIGAAIAKAIVEREAQEDLPEEERVSFVESVKTAPIRLQERWAAAKEAGAVAEAAKTAELEAAFRDKVDDAEALTPPRPPSR